MLILSESEIRSLYSMDDAIVDMEKVLHTYENGNIQLPERTVLNFQEKQASALYMPSAIEPMGKSAVKVVTIFPGNTEKGKRTTQGMILLSDTDNGEHLACMEASYLTRVRTGAASGIATKWLARETASSVAVIGCGGMAEEQLLAVLTVRSIKQIYLYNRTKQRAKSFLEKISFLDPEFKGTVTIVDDPNHAISNADILICSTRSATPVFNGAFLRPGTHINGIGSYLPHMQEVDEETLNRCSKVVVDTLEGVMEEAGDFLVPIKAGRWDFSFIHGELSQLPTRIIEGRETEEEITFFKSVGIAYFDLAVAAAVYEKAKRVGIGTEVKL